MVRTVRLGHPNPGKTLRKTFMEAHSSAGTYSKVLIMFLQHHGSECSCHTKQCA